MQRSVCVRSKVGPCFYYYERFTMLLYRPGLICPYEILNVDKNQK